MRLHISTQPLSDREWEEIEEVLLQEMETQRWYAVVVLPSLRVELFVAVQ